MPHKKKKKIYLKVKFMSLIPIFLKISMRSFSFYATQFGLYFKKIDTIRSRLLVLY